MFEPLWSRATCEIHFPPSTRAQLCVIHNESEVRGETLPGAISPARLFQPMENLVRATLIDDDNDDAIVSSYEERERERETL